MNKQTILRNFSFKLDKIVNYRYGNRSLFFDDYSCKYNEDIEQRSKKWFTGKNLPGMEVMFNLCELFDCDFEYLLGNQENFRREYRNASDYLGLSSKTVEHIAKLSDAQKHALNIMFEYYDMNKLLQSLITAAIFLSSNGNIKISLDNSLYRNGLVNSSSPLSNDLKNFEEELNQYRSEQMLMFQINQDSLEMIKHILDDESFKKLAISESRRILSERYQRRIESIEHHKLNATVPQKPDI